MKALFICGQDIGELSLGLVNDAQVDVRLLKTSPEGYLLEIKNACEKWNLKGEDVDGIAVVTGPGSFTSSRTSVTIANGLSFAWGKPLFTIENAQRITIPELTKQIDWTRLLPSGTFAVPVYNRLPNIT